MHKEYQRLLLIFPFPGVLQPGTCCSFAWRVVMHNRRNRFFEWNYDDGIVIAYERLGECNGCGDCCRAEIRFNVTGELTPGNTPWEERGNGG